ncbi:MAG: hypothetical protein ACR2QT_03165 [Woeseiaceae bacterium]
MTGNTCHQARTRISAILYSIILLFTFSAANADNPNPAFGDNGWAISNFSSGPEQNEARDIAVQGDKIVVVGTNLGPQFDVILARYNSDGSLDTSFDGDGKVVINAGGDDHGNAVAIQANGKIVIAGTSRAGTQGDFLVARLNTDGSPDLTFGTGGIVKTDFVGNDTGRALVMQGDKIVVVGENDQGGFPISFAVARYNMDGSLDTGFDSDGKVTTAISGQSSAHSVVALQADNQIVVGGRSDGISELALVRYNEDGSLDTGFDTDGIVTTSDGFAGSSFTGLAMDTDSKIVAVTSLQGVAGSEIHVLRYNTDGSLDTSFDVDGIAGTPIPNAESSGTSVEIDSDDKIVVGGVGQDYGIFDSVFVVARFNVDGTLDTTFDSVGYSMNPVAPGQPANLGTIALQTDGKIVQAGMVNQDFGVIRYNPNGSVDDTGFSAGDLTPGVAFTDFFSDNRAEYFATAIQANGKVVAAGSTHDKFNFNDDAAIARYNADGTLDNTFGTGGKVSLSFNNAFQDEAINGLAIQVDGKILAVDALRDFASSDAGILRLNSDGSVDSGFGAAGIVATDIDVDDVWNDVHVQDDGKILAVGNARDVFGSGANDMVVARFESNGVLDGTFGTGGIFRSSILESAHDVQTLPDAKILLAGQVQEFGQYFLGVVQLTPAGALDVSFGDMGGYFISPIRGLFEERFSPLDVQCDGSIVITGAEYPVSDKDFSVRRYRPNGLADTGFGAEGVVYVDLGENDQGNEVRVQSDGKILVSGYTQDENQVTDFVLIRLQADGDLDTAFANAGIGVYDNGESNAISYSMALTDGHVYMAGQARISAAVLDIEIPDASVVCEAYADVSTIPNVGGDATSDLGAVLSGSLNGYVRDGSTDALLGSQTFHPKRTPLDVGIADINGSPAMAVLGKATDGRAWVEVRDAVTGALVRDVWYASGFTPIALAVLPDMDANNCSELAVLMTRDLDNDRAWVHIKDSCVSPSNTLSTVWFESDYTPHDIEFVPNVDGNAGPELAVLMTRDSDDDRPWVHIKDAKTGTYIKNVWFQKGFTPKDLAIIDNLDGNPGSEVAVLMVKDADSRPWVHMKDALSGNYVKDVWFDSGFTPMRLATIPNLDTNTGDELAVLGTRDVDGRAWVLVKNAFGGEFIKSVWFQGDFTPRDFTIVPNMDANPGDEIAVLGVRGSGQIQVEIKDAATISFINLVNFP